MYYSNKTIYGKIKRGGGIGNKEGELGEGKETGEGYYIVSVKGVCENRNE